MDETLIREVPIMPRRKHPTGFVAHHFPCSWSTPIMVDDSETKGWDRANRALSDHLLTCDLSVPNRDPTPINPHPTRHRPR